MNHDNQNPGAALPPELLLKLLEAARAALPPEDRYREAGSLAWQITRLRQERERLGFENMSLEAYLGRLAESQGFDLQPVLAWFGIDRLTLHTPLKALCRLAKELGIASIELYAQFLRGLADEKRLPVPVAALGDAPDGRAYVEHCVGLMENLNWDPDARALFNRVRREIYCEYGERDS